MTTSSPDLLLTGGRVIDPATGRDGVADVLVRDGRIAAIGGGVAADGAERIDCSGKVVTAGLIDTHAHVFRYVTGRFGLDPEMVGVRSGVTTLVDQGGPSSITFDAFREFIVKPSATRVLCFISAYVAGGLEGHYYPDLYGPGGVDVKATVKVAKANPDLVRGVKAHAEIGGGARWGLEVIRQAKRISADAGLPLYVHLGQLWPTEGYEVPDPHELVAELGPIMQAGDVLAHPFTRHPGGFISDRTGELHPVIRDAVDRGVLVDIGHGSHFSFAMARKALAAGIRPYTLGADLHGYNCSMPEAGADAERSANRFFGQAPFCLTHAMTELLTLGLSLPDIIATVTSNAAALLRRSDEIGSLAVGREADVSVLDLASGRFQLSDNSGEKVVSDTMIRPVFCLRAGRRFDAESPLVPVPIAA